MAFLIMLIFQSRGKTREHNLIILVHLLLPPFNLLERDKHLDATGVEPQGPLLALQLQADHSSAQLFCHFSCSGSTNIREVAFDDSDGVFIFRRLISTLFEIEALSN